MLVDDDDNDNDDNNIFVPNINFFALRFFALSDLLGSLVTTTNNTTTTINNNNNNIITSLQLLHITTNIATIGWSFVGLLLALIYPYAKRHVSMPQAVLGVAFSFGIPMAFAAVGAGPSLELFSSSEGLALTPAGIWQAAQNTVPWQAWALMAGNLFWVLAYDTEYAMVDRDDDLNIGMKTSAITLGDWDVSAVIGFYLVFLAVWTAVLWGQLNLWIWSVALVVALGQVAWHHHLIKDRTREGCFKAFRLNHWLGFTVFLGVIGGIALH